MVSRVMKFGEGSWKFWREGTVKYQGVRSFQVFWEATVAALLPYLTFP